MESRINRKTKHRPGDLILDHYMPNATPEEREAARENLRGFAEVILRMCERIAAERAESAKNASSIPGKSLSESE